MIWESTNLYAAVFHLYRTFVGSRPSFKMLVIQPYQEMPPGCLVVCWTSRESVPKVICANATKFKLFAMSRRVRAAPKTKGLTKVCWNLFLANCANGCVGCRTAWWRCWRWRRRRWRKRGSWAAMWQIVWVTCKLPLHSSACGIRGKWQASVQVAYETKSHGLKCVSNCQQETEGLTCYRSLFELRQMTSSGSQIWSAADISKWLGMKSTCSALCLICTGALVK